MIDFFENTKCVSEIDRGCRAFQKLLQIGPRSAIPSADAEIPIFRQGGMGDGDRCDPAGRQHFAQRA